MGTAIVSALRMTVLSAIAGGIEKGDGTGGD